MPHEVIMPALGMAQDTGKIVSWLKQAGDAVKTGDALFEVETDKATMEVESPADGFLTDVTAGDGEDVPVGNVIALISDTAEGSGTAAPAPAAETPASDDLPEGTGVIMPALGMAQDEGVIVAWHKAPGDAVASGDILFEVETDKATMEVEAGHDGFVAALLAEAGEAAPVGEVIAIISTEAPANPVSRSWSGGAQPTPAPKTDEAKSAPAPKPAAEPVAKAAAPVATGGRILVSPKARRIALQEGLELQRLVDAGHPQPYHVSDLEVLRSLPDAAAEPTPTTAAASRLLTAEVPAKAFADFCAWATEDTGAPVDRAALLARFAAASLGEPLAAIAVEAHGQTRVTPEDAEPALTIRDLAGSPITSVNLGAEATPVLTLTGMGDTLTITLECAPGQLSAPQALSLIGGFAGRLAEPLRHLL